MAIRNYTYVSPGANQHLPKGVKIIEWAGLTAGDQGNDFIAPHYTVKTVQVFRTAGVTYGTLTIQGHIYPDGSPNYATLSNQADTDLDFTADGAEEIAENVYAIRPSLVGGDSTITVRMQVVAPALR